MRDVFRGVAASLQRRYCFVGALRKAKWVWGGGGGGGGALRGKSLKKVSDEDFVFSVLSRNQEKTKLTWRSVSSEALSALTGSVPRKMAKGRQRVSAPCGNRTQVARQSATHLNH